MDLRADVYFLILQTLKEKAIELEKLIDKKSRNIDEEGETGSYGFHSLEKDLIKGWLSKVILSLSIRFFPSILILPPIQYAAQT